MTADFPAVIGKYRKQGILLDTNLLLLLYVGLLGRNWLGKFKRIENQGFTEKDFSLLECAVDSAKIITTPHILTETSNFLCQGLHGEVRKMILQSVADSIQNFEEHFAQAKRLVKIDAFHRFGLTDSAIHELPPKQYLVLSVDAPLVIALQKKGVDAINFNHLRQYA